jgi:pimeloyl-ACP methyl ester carboxylesterase
VLLIRAEEERVLFGFWRGQRLRLGPYIDLPLAALREAYEGGLERALVARPGRVDELVRLELPGPRERERLLRLHAARAELAVEDIDRWVRRTDGASPDFLKEVVKRAAVIALGALRDKAGIEPLIAAWEGEEKFMVWVHILEALERITHQKDMKDAPTWRGWWNAVKDTFVVPGGAEGSEEDDEANKSGGGVQTRVRGTNIDRRTRGNGLPLLVLPDYGCEKDYLETYLRNLEETNQILYMSLPGSYDFTDPPLANAPGLPSPYYPIERIVDAFEELHATLVRDGKIQDKPFAIMAHGLTCWIAMKYAEQHPDKVRKMILIAPSSGQKADGEGRDRLEKQGQQVHDIELEHYAQSRVYDQQAGAYRYVPQSEPESEALTRKGWTTRFADVRDLEIGRIFGPIVEKRAGDGVGLMHKAFRPMGSVFIPEFSLFRLNKVPTATLVLVGELSIETSLDDATAIARHYGQGGRVVAFKRSSTMPFIEENDKFVDIVQVFLGGRRR